MLFDHKDFKTSKFDPAIFQSYNQGTAVQTTLNRVFILFKYSKSGFFIDLANNNFFKIQALNPDVQNYSIDYKLGEKYIYTVGGQSCKSE